MTIGLDDWAAKSMRFGNPDGEKKQHGQQHVGQYPTSSIQRIDD